MLLKLECDEIHETRPKLNDQNHPVLEVILDDVYIEKLMDELVKQLDPETILDSLKDDVIREYLG